VAGARDSSLIRIRWGLLAIREAAYAGKPKVCEIEADHIHNLPSLLDEPNEARHHYYIAQERPYYLKRLGQLADPDYADERKRFYEQPWKVLAALAMDELKSGQPAAG
jgi:hypothetical protein